MTRGFQAFRAIGVLEKRKQIPPALFSKGETADAFLTSSGLIALTSAFQDRKPRALPKDSAPTGAADFTPFEKGTTGELLFGRTLEAEAFQRKMKPRALPKDSAPTGTAGFAPFEKGGDGGFAFGATPEAEASQRE